MSRLLRLALAVGLAIPFTGCPYSYETPPAVAVDAAISSVSLANDCASEPGGVARFAGDCAEADADGCGFCQQTAVQLHLAATASDAGDSVPVEVMSVRLYAEDGTLLDELDAHALTIWDEESGGYVAWDGTITAGETLDVSVPTSAPDWTAIGGGEPWSTYGMELEVGLTLRVDGADRELQFSPAMREPEIVT